MAASVMSGAASEARSVTPPSSRKMGIAEKALPFPIDDVMTATMMKSSTDFTARRA